MLSLSNWKQEVVRDKLIVLVGLGRLHSTENVLIFYLFLLFLGENAASEKSKIQDDFFAEIVSVDHQFRDNADGGDDDGCNLRRR